MTNAIPCIIQPCEYGKRGGTPESWVMFDCSNMRKNNFAKSTGLKALLMLQWNADFCAIMTAWSSNEAKHKSPLFLCVGLQKCNCRPCSLAKTIKLSMNAIWNEKTPAPSRFGTWNAASGAVQTCSTFQQKLSNSIGPWSLPVLTAVSSACRMPDWVYEAPEGTLPPMDVPQGPAFQHTRPDQGRQVDR